MKKEKYKFDDYTDDLIDGVSLENRVSNAFMLSALCKEDKEQLNRIEEMLKQITPPNH